MGDIIKKKFGEQIKYIRKSKNCTQEQLAENIGINTRQMARIEAGESFVTSETIYKICLFFKISPKILFDFKIDSTTTNKTFEKLSVKLHEIADDTEKLDYLDIAFKALSNKSYLEKLKFIIKGIELKS